MLDLRSSALRLLSASGRLRLPVHSHTVCALGGDRLASREKEGAAVIFRTISCAVGNRSFGRKRLAFDGIAEYIRKRFS